MNDSEITIFYSWQSDLPENETRNLIQDSIKDAVRMLRGTIDVEVDRDTKGEFGSPDIAQTIFSKIDSCDIFIADVSAVCKYKTVDKEGNEKEKWMPNPNVMLELGYATKVVGWENVICILNSDYGSPNDMPFDIANRRLTPYSLKAGKSKGEVKWYLKGIIIDTVENILENGKRVKSGFSNLIVGCFVSGNVRNKLLPYIVAKSSKFVEHKEIIIDECTELLNEIKNIRLPEIQVDTPSSENESTVEDDDNLLMSFKQVLSIDLFKPQDVVIKEKDKKDIIKLTEQYLGEDISMENDFFNLGSLKRNFIMGLSPTYECEGSDKEIEKYTKIKDFEYNLHHLDLLDSYVTTFDDFLLIPLAIENISTVVDKEIDVFIQVNSQTSEVIIPSEELINPILEGIEGIIVEEDLIKELLFMSESSSIRYDTDISNCLEDAEAMVRSQFSAAGINRNPKFYSKDYKRELSKYIATPIEDSQSEFSFHISSLRAKEKKWLGPALLLKPLTESFEITYSIKSKHSDGSLNGKIKYGN